MPDPIEPETSGHISSAVVSVRPEHAAAVSARIAALPDTEVYAAAGSRIVVVMEAADARALADRLDVIAALPDVLVAAMVFEQAMDRDAVDPA